MNIATSADLDQALAHAAAAATVLSWSPPNQLSSLLRGLADRLDSAQHELLAECSAETCLPIEALRAEVERTSRQLRFMADEVVSGRCLDAVLDVADDLPTRPGLGRVRVPLGPVLVFEASNFPFAFGVLGNDVSSALAAGAPALVKVHEVHPRTSIQVGRLAHEVIGRAGLPPGTLQLIEGRVSGATALADHRIKACGFTGSLGAGRALQAIASNRPDPIPFFGELGSTNPVIVTSSAMAARGLAIVDAFLASLTLRSGQLCTKPGVIFVPAESDAVARLVDHLDEMPPTAMLGAGIAAAYEERMRVVGSVSGVLAPLAPRQPDDVRAVSPRLFVVDATTFASNRATELREENFGPAAVAVLYDGEGDLRTALSVLPGSLTASVHAEPDEEAWSAELIRDLAALAGRVIFNGWPTGVAVSAATQHGGPWPSSTDPASTSIGSAAIARWTRPISFQNFPDELLPPSLQRSNPWGIVRTEIPTR